MNNEMNKAGAVYVAQIDREKIAAKIIEAINSAPVGRNGYPLISEYDARRAVDEIARRIARSEAASGLFRSEILREVFRKFGGKVINRRFWSAVGLACYEYMPAGEVWTGCDGVEHRPAAVWLCDGTWCNSAHFARVYWSGAAFGGSTDDGIIYGRHADWTQCDEAEKTEYKIITGQRLDASRAFAVLDYEARRNQSDAERLRAALEGGADVITAYICAAVALGSVLDGIDCSFREAFGLGTSRTLPPTIHN